ncbi:MAG TPA: PepSY-like domain-containing protein [Myxococcota bacterium]|nr:PepSY-like domain-containing protein [Myxococcota bacterium]
MKRVTLAISIALAASLPVLHAQAGEKKLQEGEVPKPVIEAVKKKYPKAKLLHFEHETDDGQSVFEVGLASANGRMEVELSPDGKILEEAVLIATRDLPAEVKKGLASSKYVKWTIKHVQRVIVEEKADSPTYEVLVADDGGMTELVMDKAGVITKEEVKHGDEDDD